MAYGDNRQETASDTFDSSIDGNWDNTGPGTWDPLTWVSGGHIEEQNGFSDGVIIRTGETYADDQYSRVTVQTQGSSTLHSCLMRQQAGDDTAYAAIADNAFNDEFGIYEITDGSAVQIGAGSGASADIPMSDGEIVTGEIEGTTIRVGSDVGGDHEEDSQTDNTLTSGDPGVMLTRIGGVNPRATAWSGGDIAIVDISHVAALADSFDNVVQRRPIKITNF